MRILKNENGTFCADCKQVNDCICFPDDEMVELEYRRVLYRTSKATKYLLKKQTLPNGKVIKTGTDIWFPNLCTFDRQTGSVKKIKVEGWLVNKIV